MNELPLAYESVKQQLLQRLRGHWKPGDRLPTSANLARELGAGQRNTHRAMAELAGEGFLVSMPGKGTFVARRAETLLQRVKLDAQLAGARVGILTVSLHPPAFVSSLVEMMTAALEGLGATSTRLVYKGTHTETSLARSEYDALDAAVLVQPSAERPIRLRPNQPALMLSTTSEILVDAAGGYDMVTASDRQGGALAARALKAAGCRSACFVGVGRPRSQRTGKFNLISISRLAGFEAGWGEGLPAEHLLHCTSYSIAPAARMVHHYLKLKDRPQGVFAASDELAEGFALGTMAQGLEPGRDYMLVGYDGQHAYQPLEDCPPITSAAVPAQEMVRRGVELFTHRMAQPDRPAQQIVLNCSLFAGMTARCPGTSAS